MSGWSDPSGASPLPRWGERARVAAAMRSFPPIEWRRLLPEPGGSVDHPLLGVDGLGNAAQKHCCSSDVLASSSELWEVVPLVYDVILDLAGATPGNARRVMRMGRNVLRRACRLVPPPLS